MRYNFVGQNQEGNPGCVCCPPDRKGSYEVFEPNYCLVDSDLRVKVVGSSRS